MIKRLSSKVLSCDLCDMTGETGSEIIRKTVKFKLQARNYMKGLYKIISFRDICKFYQVMYIHCIEDR